MFMIIPMIDIIFFLLVFFMMNSLQTVTQRALDVQLPQAASAKQTKSLPIIVAVDGQGHIAVDNRPVSITELSDEIGGRMAKNPAETVVLQADTRTAHGQVVAVMDTLKKNGVKKLSIGAAQKE